MVHILAPGDYAPEKSANLLLDHSPKYTFGMKTQTVKPVDTPGTIIINLLSISSYYVFLKLRRKKI